MKAASDTPAGAAGDTSPRLVIAALAVAGMATSVSQTAVLPLQADLPRLLDADPDQTAWAVTVTLLVSAICMPISGRLGDVYGKRRVLVAVMLISTAGAVVCALSQDIVTLIIGRALQGPGVGSIPLGIAILRDAVPPRLLASAVGIVSATLGVGGAIGLPISATAAQHLGWHAVFVTSGLVTLLGIVLILAVVPPSPRHPGGKLDAAGITGLAVGLTGVLLAISRGSRLGWTSWQVLGLAGGGVAILVAWAGYELRRPHPLVDLRLAARRPVLMTNLASVALGFTLFTSSVAFPLVLQGSFGSGGLGLSLVEASLVMTPTGLAMLVVAPLVGRLEKLVGIKYVVVLSAGVMGVGYLVCLMGGADVGTILAACVLVGAGVGLGFAAVPIIIMRSVEVSASAAANGFNTLMRSLGITAAAAVIAVVFASSSEATTTTPTAAGFQLAAALGMASAAFTAMLIAFVPGMGRPREGASGKPEQRADHRDSESTTGLKQ